MRTVLAAPVSLTNSMAIEARNRLLRGSEERQTGQLHPISGTPVEVPDPSTVTRIVGEAEASNLWGMKRLYRKREEQ